MRAAHLRARERRRFRCTTDSRHGMAIRDNLLARRFAVLTPNTSWATNITYLWTCRVGYIWR
jgi:putative transposase